MSLLTSLLAFAVAIGILVVVHEFGHYSVARLCGVKVLRFSVGFGKPLFTWVSKKTGTEWSVASLPLGGYVKMLDERESEAEIAPQDLPCAFNRQSVGKRFAIVAAGPVANFILAIALFAGVFIAGVNEPVAVLGSPPAASLAATVGLRGGDTIVGLRGMDGSPTEAVRSWNDLRWKLLDAAFDRRSVMLLASHDGETRNIALDLSDIRSSTVDDNFLDHLGLVPGGETRIMTVEPGSPAAQAGLATGDVLRSLDSLPIGDVQAFIAHIRAASGRPLRLGIERDGAARAVIVTPRIEDGTGRIGAALGTQLKSVEVRYGPLESVALGARRTWEISVFSVRMFGRMITGEASLKNLSGPVTIADYAGRSARMGLSAFVSFLALVSISLGVLNLLPIPVLDGGHLLYYSVEAVTGKAVSDRWQAILQRAGLVCILALSVVALFNDLTRLVHL
jgi:regulator of sigma E protease